MGFDSNKFQNEQFTDRTQMIKVPDLQAFFDADPVWTVRGMTGSELARVNEASEKVAKLVAIAEGLAAPEDKKTTEAIRDLLGMSRDVPADLVKRLEMLIIASVEPRVDRQTAVKLAESYPIEFYSLTGAILKLTGQGRQPGKQNGSGETPRSEP